MMIMNTLDHGGPPSNDPQQVFFFLLNHFIDVLVGALIHISGTPESNREGQSQVTKHSENMQCMPP